MTISQKKFDKVMKYLEEEKVEINQHAILDIIKQGYPWTTEFILECMKNGKHFEGRELYENNDVLPEEELKRRFKRSYCIHKINIFGKLIIIGYYIKNEILVIHISPLNRGSKEGKIYTATL